MLIAQRDDDAVVGCRGLQLEVERAAEALAQREAPGPVDARAEGRVQHQLHAAAFVEESFGDDGVDARQRSERGGAGAHVKNGLLCTAPVETALVDEEIDGRIRLRLAKRIPIPFRRIFARSSDTAVDSSHVRPGASPRQNGIVGAAPFASSTRTRPASTRRMRHDVEPSMNTSPAMLSTAKSSSSVPTTVSSGSASTRNCALSGIAPPEVIAARRAPRLPRTTPCTRSRWRNAPLRPRFVLMPSDSMSMTASKSAPRQIGIAIGASNEREKVVFLPVFRGRHGDDLLPHDVERSRPARAGDRARPAKSSARAPRIRSARRGWSRRSVPWAWSCARPDAPIARCAAARPRSIAASRSGRRDRRCRCRCRARATPWRRRPSACRSSGALRPFSRSLRDRLP